MAFSKVKTDSIADSGVTTAKIANDAVVASKVDDDGTGFTVGNLTNSGTLQQTGQVTLGTGSGSGGSWTLPTSRGANDKYVLQIDTSAGAADWVESLVAPEVSSHNYDVSGSTDDGGINAYEAPYAVTGTTTNASTTISAITTTNIKAGQYISGAGIPADTTVSSISSAGSSNNGTIVISNQATAAASGVALKIQKTPGEKNGGKVILTGTNFGVNVADISVAITTSGGSIIANASYISGLSGTSVTAEWTGTEGTYSTDLTSSYAGKIYFKVTKSGLASNVYDSNTTLTSDATLTELSTSSQTGGDRSATPSATSLGTYGSGKVAGGGQESNTKALLNFDRFGGTDFEDSSNTGGDGFKPTGAGDATIKASPFGDGKSAMFFDGSNDKFTVPNHADFSVGSNAWSIDYWVCVDTSDAGGMMSITNINNSNSPTESNSGLVLYQDSSNPDQLHWYMDDDSTADWDIHSAATGFTFAENLRWHHIALTYGGSSDQNYRLFVDGRIIKTVSTSATMQSSSGNQGIVFGTNQNAGAWFKGYIDEIRWVVGENPFPATNFTPSQYRYGTTGATHEVSTAANMKLLVHSNQDHSAISGDGRAIYLNIEGDGVYQRTETTARNSSAASNWDNSAWYFDGGSSGALHDPYGGADNNYADVCPSATSEMTVEFWVKSNSTSSTQMYLIDAGSTGWNLRYTPSSNAWVLFSNAFDSNGQMSLGTHDVADNAWHHVALVKYVDGSNKNRVKFYIDGVLKTTSSNNTSDSNAVWPTNNAFRIGGDGGFFDGYIDDFRITKGLVVYTGAFTPPTTKLTTTWSAGTNIAANSDASKVVFLLKSVDGNSGTEGFVDSATTGTTHTITPTGGAKHQIGYGGIAPAIAWPASGKVTGSAGVYLDGNDNIDFNGAVGPSGAGVRSIEAWVYQNQSSSGDYQYLWSYGEDATAKHFGASLFHGGYLRFQGHGGAIDFDTSATQSSFLNKWRHVAATYDGTTVRMFVDGTQVGSEARTLNTSDDSGSGDNMHIGYSIYSDSAHYFNGYIDGFRVSHIARHVNNSGTYTYPVPTRMYGAFGQETPDAGTITLTATGSGDYTWSEVAGGTALPGTLAVGSTTHSGSGNSRTHTATITGTFPTFTNSTFTNGARSDLATNNILLKAQNDTDSTKAVTLGSSGGYDGINIVQKSTERPVLFNGRRYVGNTTGLRQINGLGFRPDLVWIKDRDGTNSHTLTDSVRGAGYSIYANTNDGNDTTANGITGFLNDGFQLGKAGTGNSNVGNNVNGDNLALIAWAWKAGGRPSSSALSLSGGVGAGTIANGSTNVTAITQSVNQNSGFSITKYTGGATGTNQTSAIPHNLGGTPDWIMVKNISGAYDWVVYHKDLTTDKNINLNNTAAEDTKIRGYIDAPDSTNINLHASTEGTHFGRAVNRSGDNFICYAWKAVPGVSAFGYHQGTISSVSGTQVGANGYCGFKPRMIIIRCFDTTEYWVMFDKFRETTDTFGNYLFANTTAAEAASSGITVTVTDTGFTTGTASGVGSGSQKYISMAFA